MQVDEELLKISPKKIIEQIQQEHREELREKDRQITALEQALALAKLKATPPPTDARVSHLQTEVERLEAALVSRSKTLTVIQHTFDEAYGIVKEKHPEATPHQQEVLTFVFCAYIWNKEKADVKMSVPLAEILIALICSEVVGKGTFLMQTYDEYRTDSRRKALTKQVMDVLATVDDHYKVEEWR